MGQSSGRFQEEQREEGGGAGRSRGEIGRGGGGRRTLGLSAHLSPPAASRRQEN